MLPAVQRKPEITIVGPGRLAGSLAPALHRVGYCISEIVSRIGATFQRRARNLASSVKARSVTAKTATLGADVFWFCVPDRELAHAAAGLASLTEWNGKIALHSSGALSSDELNVLRDRGALVGSVHPMMTFVCLSQPSLKEVPFAIEGDARALRVARRIVNDLGGVPFTIRKENKAAYHAWGTFASPLLLSALVSAEQVAQLAGLSAKQARSRILPIAFQTLKNYVTLGPEQSFSGPIVRGDAGVVQAHLKALKTVPEVREVYRALARAALRYLPAKEREALEAVLGGR